MIREDHRPSMKNIRSIIIRTFDMDWIHNPAAIDPPGACFCIKGCDKCTKSSCTRDETADSQLQISHDRIVE